MIRKFLTWICLALSASALALAVFLVAPGDVFELLVGFIVGTLGTAQWILLAVLVVVLGCSIVAGQPLTRWHKRVAIIVGIVAVTVAASVFVVDRKDFSRENVSFVADNFAFGATLYHPRDKREKHPAILILHGSGPIRRDAYHVFARRFAARGFIVLNVDKRGVGESGGNYYGDDLGRGVIQKRTTDAIVALEYLRSMPDVDTARIGAFSMSQGGWVVPALLDGTTPARYGVVFSGVAFRQRKRASGVIGPVRTTIISASVHRRFRLRRLMFA